MNTGYQGWTGLLKVVDGGTHDGEPLDINNQLCSETGLPQVNKPNIDSDPDYIAPVLNLEECPNTYKFYSFVVGRTATRGLIGDNGGAWPNLAPYQGYSALANDNIIVNTLPGIQTNDFFSSDIIVLNALLAGNYSIKVEGTGQLTMFTDNGYSFDGFVDFFIEVDSTLYPLSPSFPSPPGYDIPGYQYRLISPGGSDSHKEVSVSYNITLDTVVTLSLASVIKFYLRPRFAAVTGKAGNLKISNVTLKLTIERPI